MKSDSSPRRRSIASKLAADCSSVRVLAILVPLSITLSLLGGSCRSTPVPKGIDNTEIVVGAVKSVNPLDIVVLPIQNNTGLENLPLDRMRRDFHAGLVRLRYSPLALDYVDTRAVEAAYTPGDLQEQAILQVFLVGWDDRHWQTRSRLGIQAEIFLLDPRQPSVSKPLWGGKVARQVDLMQERAAFPTDEALLGRAVDRFVEDVLASLPARNPELVTQ